MKIIRPCNFRRGLSASHSLMMLICLVFYCQAWLQYIPLKALFTSHLPSRPIYNKFYLEACLSCKLWQGMQTIKIIPEPSRILELFSSLDHTSKFITKHILHYLMHYWIQHNYQNIAESFDRSMTKKKKETMMTRSSRRRQTDNRDGWDVMTDRGDEW